MESQVGAGDGFYANEVLQEPRSLENVSEMADVYDAPLSRELAYPKLDGILFPIVVANADIVAPCRWMGGAEVSLTVALNNYYQAMTEENADQVIADVYDFLANQSKPVEEVKGEEPERESETVASPEKTNSKELINEALPSRQAERNTQRSQQQKEAQISKRGQADNKSVVDGEEVVENPVLPHQSVNNEKKTAVQRTVTAVDKASPVNQPDLTISNVEPSRQAKKNATNRQAPEVSKVDSRVTEPEPAAAPQPISDREPTANKESDNTAGSENELALPEVHIQPNDEIEHVSDEPVPQYSDVEGMSAEFDVLLRETEMDDATDGSLDIHTTDGYDEGESEDTLFGYDDAGENLERVGSTLNDEAVEDSDTEVWDEADSGFIETPAESVQRMREALNDIADSMNTDESQISEEMTVIESAISMLSRELEDYESVATELNQSDIEELQKILTKLLDDIELAHVSVSSDVEGQLNMEQYLNREDIEGVNEIMRVPTLYNRAKGLLFVVSALIKRISSRTLLVGKSVLRLHTSDHKGDYQRIVSYS